ncbi:MAG TPA: hypothetical protein VMR70_11755 [Flavisolibacter sp.]|nr:hypothetical protein [Flavisolibacter sp.]
MKKILTLMMAVGTITLAQAQSSRSYPDGRYGTKDVILGSQNDRNDRNDRNNRTYGNNSRYTYSFSAKERDKAIDRIDRDYDKRIRQVERDRSLRSYEKTSQIRRLQEQKRHEVAQIWERFRNNSNVHRDNSYQRNNRGW